MLSNNFQDMLGVIPQLLGVDNSLGRSLHGVRVSHGTRSQAGEDHGR